MDNNDGVDDDDEWDHSLWKSHTVQAWQNHRKLSGDRGSITFALASSSSHHRRHPRHPYIICDFRYHVPGYSTRVSIGRYFNVTDALSSSSSLQSLYNRDDKTCYLLSTTVTLAEGAVMLSSSLNGSSTNEGTTPQWAVQPLLPAMKWREGTRDVLNKLDEWEDGAGVRMKISFCPGWADDVDDEHRGSIFGVHGGNFVELLRHRRELYDDDGDDAMSNEGDDDDDTGRSSRDGDDDVTDECLSLLSTNVNKVKAPHGGDNTTRLSAANTLTIDLISGNNNGNSTNTSSSSWSSIVSQCVYSTLTRLSRRHDVCGVSVVPPLELFNVEAQWITQSGRKDERPFFDVGLTGDGQVVACSDTGIDLDNCYFADSNLRGYAKSTRRSDRNRKVTQYITYADDTDYTGGHGTHVAATIVGKKINGRREDTNGAANGIARDAKLAFFDIHKNGRRDLSVPEDKIEDLMDPGRNAGAKIHSASWGSNINEYGDLENAFDEYAHKNDDFLIIVAAGNTGRTSTRIDIMKTVSSPGTAKNVITVGATQSSGQDLDPQMLGPSYLADFSSRGPTSDGRTKPEILAPGYKILSAKARPSHAGECDDSEGTMFAYGTSMAAPVVSGNAALVRQYFEEGWYPLGKGPDRRNRNDVSAALIKAVLINGGQAMKGVQNEEVITATSPYDNHQNFGRLSLIDSLPLNGRNNLKLFIEDRKNISNRRTHQYEFTAIDGCDVSDFSVTLVWNDPPASPGCKQCVLNDLDLYAKVAGKTHYPNGLNSKDAINNSERIRMIPKTNDYITVFVKAYDLDSRSQDYALVVSGCFEEGHEITDDRDHGRTGDRRSGISEGNAMEEEDMTNDYFNIEPPLTLQTEFTGQYRHDGSMFDIVAKNTIHISTLSIHTTATSSIKVTVWTKKGEMRNAYNNESSWTIILSTTVVGRGQHQETILPPFPQQVTVPSGDVQAFYVSLETEEMLFSRSGGRFGSLAVRNDDLSVLMGLAKGRKFGKSFTGWLWNGGVYYRR